MVEKFNDAGLFTISIVYNKVGTRTTTLIDTTYCVLIVYGQWLDLCLTMVKRVLFNGHVSLFSRHMTLLLCLG